MENWVDYSVTIDFEVPNHIRLLMEDCERLDKENSYAYFNYAESLSDQCKYACTVGGMSVEQWETIDRRYLNGF